MEDKNVKPNNLEWGEIVAENSIMMNAGSVTTAIAMANVIFQLLKNPATMHKLREELDAVLEGDDEVAPNDKVKHLPYLRACLDESLATFLLLYYFVGCGPQFFLCELSNLRYGAIN